MFEFSEQEIEAPSKKSIRGGPCPSNVCDCGYYGLTAPGLSSQIFDVSAAEYKGLTIARNEVVQMVAQIGEISTPNDYDTLRNKIREDYRITFRLQTNGDPQIDKVHGLCRKTRDKVRRAFRDLFEKDSKLLISILDRDSLFSDEME